MKGVRATKQVDLGYLSPTLETLLKEVLDHVVDKMACPVDDRGLLPQPHQGLATGGHDQGHNRLRLGALLRFQLTDDPSKGRRVIIRAVGPQCDTVPTEDKPLTWAS